MNLWLIVLVIGTMWFVVLTTSWAVCRLAAEADSRQAEITLLEQMFER